MDKDIRQYLHYYLGCDFWTPNSQGNLNAMTLHHVIALVEKGVKVQLLLRKLESMTEEEALNIARRCFFNNDMKYPDSDFKVSREATVYVVELSNDWWQKEIRMGLRTGNIWYTNPTAGDRVHHLFETHHYLLSKGFDLFGLIDAGLAINKETLTP